LSGIALKYRPDPENRQPLDQGQSLGIDLLIRSKFRVDRDDAVPELGKKPSTEGNPPAEGRPPHHEKGNPSEFLIVIVGRKGTDLRLLSLEFLTGISLLFSDLSDILWPLSSLSFGPLSGRPLKKRWRTVAAVR
jgi:hypothetical protein